MYVQRLRVFKSLSQPNSVGIGKLKLLLAMMRQVENSRIFNRLAFKNYSQLHQNNIDLNSTKD